jgi:heme/copper-type cytochrome/quinol oxidase subunit 2
MVWEQILEKLGQLDFWSMGIGIVLVVVAFFVYAAIKKRRNKI